MRGPHTVADESTLAAVHVLATAFTGPLVFLKRLPCLAAGVPPIDHFAYVVVRVVFPPAEAVPNTVAPGCSVHCDGRVRAFEPPGGALAHDEVVRGHTNL